MSARYRDNLQLVLKDLSIDVQPGEKVRTLFLNLSFHNTLVSRLALSVEQEVAKAVYVSLCFV